MADVLTLEVATPSGLALRTEAEGVQAPSVEGEFGVLPGHLPLLAALRCGLLKYRHGNKEFVAAVGPGFVEAEPDKVLLLTDLFALPDAIDADETKKELGAAEKALAAHFDARKKRMDDLGKGKDEAEVREALEDMQLEEKELQRNVDWAQARLEAKAFSQKI